MTKKSEDIGEPGIIIKHDDTLYGCVKCGNFLGINKDGFHPTMCTMCGGDTYESNLSCLAPGEVYMISEPKPLGKLKIKTLCSPLYPDQPLPETDQVIKQLKKEKTNDET